MRVAFPLAEVRALQGRTRWTIVLGLLLAAVGRNRRGSAGEPACLRPAPAHDPDAGVVVGRPATPPLAGRHAGAPAVGEDAQLDHRNDSRRRCATIRGRAADPRRDPVLDGGGRPARRPRRLGHVHEPGRRSTPRHPAGVAVWALPFSLRRAAEEAVGASEPAAVEVETGSPARWLRCAFVPVGEDGSLLLVIRDVTQARRLESVRRDFVTNASHELKTPVASIQAAAETIVNATVDDPAAVPRFAQRVEREALRLTRIVSDLLDLSRLESGSDRAEPVDLGAVVREETERVAEAAAAPAPPIAVDARATAGRGGVGTRPAAARAEPGRQRPALHAPRTAGSRSRSDSTTDGPSLRVADTGIGIPRATCPASSSASTASTGRARARRAARAWACRSSSTWSRTTAARSTSRASSAGAPLRGPPPRRLSARPPMLRADGAGPADPARDDGRHRADPHRVVTRPSPRRPRPRPGRRAG